MAVAASTVLEKTMSGEDRATAEKLAERLGQDYLTIGDLRRARRLTQTELAARLGKKQVSIAQLEKRTDMLLSTLRHYIEAMGGKLELTVEFPGQPPMRIASLADGDVEEREKRLIPALDAALTRGVSDAAAGSVRPIRDVANELVERYERLAEDRGL